MHFPICLSKANLSKTFKLTGGKEMSLKMAPEVFISLITKTEFYHGGTFLGV